MSKREYDPGTLGWWMDNRRGELGLTWDELADNAGVSAMTLRRNAENPSGMRTTTKKGIERALSWEYGSVDLIFTGAEPQKINERPEDAADADPDDLVWANLRAIRKTAEEQLQKIEDMEEEFLRRRRGG